ncbi:MAG: haloacid dehalogenase-like hydrolase [Nakamurella sp.]
MPLPEAAPSVIAGPPVTAVLWDIDGTLLSSGGVASRAFLDAIADVVGRRPEGRGLDLGGRIDPEIAATLLASVDADQALVPAVLDRLRVITTARSAELRDHVRVLPGVPEALGMLAAAGVLQTVVTGNIETVGMLKLQGGQLIPPIDPALGGFGDHGRNRVEVAELSLHRLAAAGWLPALDQCWIVGDTPRDLLCAQALGVRCALVATGRHSLESMRALGADVVIAGLDESDQLSRLWNLPA